jgi:YfiH family protein
MTRAASAHPWTTVVEEPADADLPVLVSPVWRTEFPWLVHGTVGTDADMGLFGHTASGLVQERWARLRAWTRCDTAVHARQVHGAKVLHHRRQLGALVLHGDADGHVCAEPAQLLTVAVADCVPVFMVDPASRLVALLHAGWRGTAAGVLEAGIADMVRAGAEPDRLHVHLGAAICGECYEVGPEVFDALGEPVRPRPRTLDLRAVLAQRAVRHGVSSSRITVSGLCTLTSPALYSHRGGDRGRNLAFIATHR